MSLKTHVAGQVRTWGYLFDKDLQHVPAELEAASPGGKARSPRCVAIECAVFNKLLTETVNGTSPSGEAAMQAYYGDNCGALESSCPDLAAVRSAVAESVVGLASAVESGSEEDLLKTVMAPWGMEMTLADLVLHGSAHMAYHSGQVNYVQLLNGDEQMHWM